MPRWKKATPAALALISPTRSSRAVLRQFGSWSRCGRSAISVIRPTMTVLPLTTPRNFPTVARDALPGAVGVSPTVTCAPLTARTRPSVSRGARAGAAAGSGERGAAAEADCVARVDSGPVSDVASFEDASRAPAVGNYIRNDLGISVKPRTALGFKPAIHRGSSATLRNRQPITIRVRGPMRAISRRNASAFSATQPAVGAKPGRATWMNTALPRPAIRGRVLWSSSMIRS